MATAEFLFLAGEGDGEDAELRAGLLIVDHALGTDCVRFTPEDGTPDEVLLRACEIVREYGIDEFEGILYKQEHRETLPADPGEDGLPSFFPDLN